jgi:hypothetical protein
VAAVVEAARHQPDLRDHPLPLRETRPPSRHGRCGRSHPPPIGSPRPPGAAARRVVVAVIETARRAMVAGARLGGGCECGAAAALVLVRWMVGREEVAEHPLHRLRHLRPCHAVVAPPPSHFTSWEEREKREGMEERDREWTEENHEREGGKESCFRNRVSLLNARD